MKQQSTKAVMFRSGTAQAKTCQCTGCCKDHPSGPCDDKPYALLAVFGEVAKQVCIECISAIVVRQISGY